MILLEMMSSSPETRDPRHIIMEIYCSIVVVAAANNIFFVVFPTSHCVLACGGVPVGVTCWRPKQSKKIPDILVVDKISRLFFIYYLFG